MKIKVFDDHFEKGFVNMDISFKDRLTLRIHRKLYLYHATKKGWKGELPFYIVHCSQHGYFLDYLHGFPGYNEGFNCPGCLKEFSREVLHV